MRVLFLTHRLPYAPNRGDRLRAFHEIDGLLRAGIEVDLLSLVHDADEAAQAPGMAREGLRVHVAHVPRLANHIRGGLALLGRTPLTMHLLRAPMLLVRARKVVEERPPDVVLAFCSGMAWVARQRPLDRFPLVLDMVDVDSEKWRRLADTAPWPMSLIYQREARLLSEFEGHVALHARVNFVVNERERAALLARAPDARVEVLSNGIDLEYFRRPSDAPAREPRVVFCGVMNYTPNAEGAVWLARDVWPRVRAAVPHARLDIVGATPSPAVRALANEALGIAVTGSVPDVRPYLWRATVAAAPLHVARGVQNKVLEAAAAGLPSVVTPAVAHGLPDAVRGASWSAQSASDFRRLVIDGLRGNLRPVCPALPELGWPATTAGLVKALRAVV